MRSLETNCVAAVSEVQGITLDEGAHEDMY